MREMKKLVFELQKTQLPNHEKCRNILMFKNIKNIEILGFNYDAEGNALVLVDGKINYMCPKILRFIFFSGWCQLIEN